jgi:hypothetical protein
LVGIEKPEFKEDTAIIPTTAWARRLLYILRNPGAQNSTVTGRRVQQPVGNRADRNNSDTRGDRIDPNLFLPSSHTHVCNLYNPFMGMFYPFSAVTNFRYHLYNLFSRKGHQNEERFHAPCNITSRRDRLALSIRIKENMVDQQTHRIARILTGKETLNSGIRRGRRPGDSLTAPARYRTNGSVEQFRDRR